MKAKTMLLAAVSLGLSAAAAAQTTQSSAPTTSPTTQPSTNSAVATPNVVNQSEPNATAPAADTSAAPAQASPGPVSPATAADVVAGKAVFDTAGGSVGKVESVSASGAVVATGKVRAQIPIASFAKNASGLVIAMNRSQLEAAAQGAAHQ